MECELMKKFDKKEFLSIPNIMGYFRLLLIPFFCYFYLISVDDGYSRNYWIAVGILVVSTLTDFFDGKIARKFDMITELGKALDPVADKLTHGAVAICVAFEYPLMWILLSTMLIKEGYMLLMNQKLLKQGKFLGSARWYGKLCTGMLFCLLILLIIWREIPIILSSMLIIITIVDMVFTGIMYHRVFKELLQE